MLRVENNYEIETTYFLTFTRPNGSGYCFDCDENGVVDEGSLKPAGLENYRKCVDGTYDVKREVEKRELRFRLCSCGSGKRTEDIFDARGIFVARVCGECKEKSLKGYRREIFTDPNYEHDEPISEDHFDF